jgi:hypothetical protein
MFSQDGSRRPIRLIDYRSLINYLNELPSGADPSTITPRGKHLLKAEGEPLKLGRKQQEVA